MNPRETAFNGLWRENPALVQMLGLCPLLAVSTTLVNGLVLGFLTLAVLALASMLVSAIRPWLSDIIRLPAQIMIIASLVTVADLGLQAFFFEMHQRVGLFVALIVTNCAILGRTESYGRRNPVSHAGYDGLMMGAGFLAAITALSALRELLGQGTLLTGAELVFGPAAAGWEMRLAPGGFLLVVLPPGAFLCLGCLLALKNWIDQRWLSEPVPGEPADDRTSPPQPPVSEPANP